MRTLLKQVVDSYYHTSSNEQTGRTGQLVFGERKGRHVDDFAEFRGDRPCQRNFLKQVVDSYYHARSNEQRGRTAQFVKGDTKVSQVDELAEFGGDRPCQRK